MLRDKVLIWLFLLVLAMLLVPFLHADDAPGSHARLVRVTSVSGQVQVSHQQGGGYRNATMNVPIVQGDTVRTGDDGWVEIQLENGSRIRIAPDSQIDFPLLSRFASGSTATEVNLDQGEAAFAVVAGDDIGPFQVNVHQRVMSLKRSSRFRVTSIPSDPLEVVVWRGEVGIFDREAGQEVIVKTRETFTLDPQDAGHYNLENDAQVDELDDWANQRDQALMAYADTRTETPALPLSYGQPLQYSNPPALYSTGLGWDPFLNGYWGFAGAGFGYPFGWTPWLWQPGFPVIFVPTTIRPPRRPPVGRPPVPPAVKAAAGSPAFTVTTDNRERSVISNEHVPVENMTTAEGEALPQTNSLTQPLVRVHPPVEMPVVTPTEVVAKPGATQARTPVAPSRPQTSAPPVRAYSAPRMSSAPSSAPHASGGAHK